MLIRVAVETVNIFKFFGIHIPSNLTLSHHTYVVIKKMYPCIYYLQHLRRFGMSWRVLTNLHRCAIENYLAGCLVWQQLCS